jgi:hypothetical protein
MKKVTIGMAMAILVSTGFGATVGHAQTLRESLEGVFTDVLDLQLGGPPGTQHGDHFKPGNVSTSARVIGALSSFISANASSYPLSSTTSGLTFDLSSGVPVAATTSAGPIFVEQARTLGRGMLSFGGTVSYLNLEKLRGVRTQDLHFGFTHEDADGGGLGTNPNEFDNIDMAMNLDINATVAAIHATYGITDRIDVGVAIPIVHVSMSAKPWAHMNSYTYASTGTANHFFGGTETNPVLSYSPTPLDQSSSGIGDIALRAKAYAYAGKTYDVGFLAEARLGTGKKEDFLGSGSTDLAGMALVSGHWGGINPHLNLGYRHRGSDLERDEVGLAFGYDQKASETVTLVVEWSGLFETGSQIEALKFPGLIPIGEYQVDGQTYAKEYVSPTNIPNRPNDNIVNAAFGLKYSPKSNLVLLANVLFPLNDGGLRSSWSPTVGLSYNL